MDISLFINETLPGNMYRGLDGQAHDFHALDPVLLAQSGYDPIFKLNQNYGWGRRWYALHKIADHFVFTVGHGYWCARREIPAEDVADILSRYFSRSEITEQGNALLG